MKKLFTFYLNKGIKIEIKRYENDEKIYRFEEIKIYLYVGNKKYILYDDDFMGYGILTFKDMLNWAIKNELELGYSIKKEEIGILMNDYYHFDKEDYEKIGLEMKKGNGRKSAYWVGEDYHFWESQSYSSWLYNEKRNIVLEITPDYKWHSIDPKAGENYISYEEFRKNYKTIFKTIIPKDVAIQWLKQCEEIEKRMVD